MFLVFPFIRGIVLTLAVLLSIILLIVTLIKRRKIFICLLALSMCISVFVPMRMYKLKQSSVPVFNTSDMSAVHDGFKNKVKEGEKLLAEQSYINSDASRMHFCNEDNTVNYELVSYMPRFENELYHLKEDAVIKVEDENITFWASEMEPQSFAWYSALIGVCGRFAIENKETGEVFYVSYRISEYNGSNSIFPTYPDFDIFEHLLTNGTMLD